jgi:hypothetical protein
MISNKKSYQLQSFITFRDLQLLFLWFYHTRSFEKLEKLRIKMIFSGGSLRKPPLEIMNFYMRFSLGTVCKITISSGGLLKEPSLKIAQSVDN